MLGRICYFTRGWRKSTTQVRGQALPRLMYLYITEELPRAIQDPAQWPKIIHELCNIQQVMQVVIAPKEKKE